TQEETIIRLRHIVRHARACPGQPRPCSLAARKTWMAGTSPAMTEERGNTASPDDASHRRENHEATLGPLSHQPLASGPKTCLQHLLVDLADAGHRQF